MGQRFGGKTMRKIIDPQMKIREIAIADIQIDLQSRDEIPKVLIGLQKLYCDRSLRKKVFEAFKDRVPDNVCPDKGRRGMNLRTIPVLGVIRLICNRDYDRLTDIVDNHITLRMMSGFFPHQESISALLYRRLKTISGCSNPQSLIKSIKSQSTAVTTSLGTQTCLTVAATPSYVTLHF